MNSSEREAFILQSVNEGWTLQELGDKLGVTRQRARQLLQKAGLDQVRVKWRGVSGNKRLQEKPVKWCRECGLVITAKNQQKYCSEACRAVRDRRYHSERYRTDPSRREYHARYQREHPEVVKAAKKRYKQSFAYHQMKERLREQYASAPRLLMHCLDCGAEVWRKQAVVDGARRLGQRTPLCKDCRAAAGIAGRRK